MSSFLNEPGFIVELIMQKILNMKTSNHILILSLSFVYIVFGFLKVIDKSPIKDLVTDALPFMENSLLFALFGLGEIILGASLLIKKLRLLGSIGIILHLLSTFVAIPLAWGMIYDSNTVITLHGEFVAKNLVLIAAALNIFANETKKENAFA